MVEAGTFRRDLYYRLSVVTIRVPPLRERGEDLVILAKQLLSDIANGAGRRIDGFADSALGAIRRYPWPGNVRELRNAIERAVVLGDSPLVQLSDLPAAVAGASNAIRAVDPQNFPVPITLAEVEKLAIEAALLFTRGNRTTAAALLGISRTTLHNKLRD